MTANRKADLQRKLTLAAIPKPPAGLAERIKTDIPKHLPTSTELDRKRLNSAVAFNMRVAASVLLLVGSLFFALHLLNRAYQEQDQHYAAFNDALKNDKAPSPAVSQLPKPPRQAPQVVTSTDQPPAVIAPPKSQLKQEQAPVQLADARDQELRRDREESKDAKEAKKENDEAEKLKALGYVSGRVAETATVAGGTAAPASSANEPQSKVAAAPPAPAFVPAPPPPPPATAKTARAAAAMDGFAANAQAAELAFTPSTMFGYAFMTRSVGAAAPLVQHFAAPETRPRRGVQVEADAAPSAFDATKSVLRISIDTPAKSGSDDATPAPVAADATLEIVFDPNAVAAHRALTGEPSTSQPLLVEGTSVTAVYELELKPSLSRRARVATVRLRYHALPDGRSRTIERELRVRDLASSFDKASPRLKRAALAAALGDARAHGSDTSAIAEKAKALGFSELAALAH